MMNFEIYNKIGEIGYNNRILDYADKETARQLIYNYLLGHYHYIVTKDEFNKEFERFWNTQLDEE